MSIPSKFRQFNCTFCGRPLSDLVRKFGKGKRLFCNQQCEGQWHGRARSRGSRAAGPGFDRRSN